MALAEAAGIDCERGIVVDDQMRTSAPGVVAVGECAQHSGIVYGLVAPIYEQARVAAGTLTGQDGASYAGSVPWARLKVAGIDLVSIGTVDGESGASTVDADRRDLRKLAVTDGRLTGAILLGDTRGTELLLEAVRSGEQVDDPLQRSSSRPRPAPRICPTAPRSATATASARATSSRPSPTTG